MTVNEGVEINLKGTAHLKIEILSLTFTLRSFQTNEALVNIQNTN